MLSCAKCMTSNQENARFCVYCGTPLSFNATLKKSGIGAPLVILLTFLGICGLCGIVGGIQNAVDKKQEKKTEVATIQPSPTVIPSPTPLAFTDLKARANELMKMEKDEYTLDDVKAFDEIMTPLRAITKDQKNYKEAQALNKKLIDKSSVIGAEIVVLGKKPENSGWDGRVQPVVSYLRENLNDFNSSEFIEWSPVAKMKVKGEPFWVVRLKLRAKNMFGGMILKDTYYFIRQGKVVYAEGL